MGEGRGARGEGLFRSMVIYANEKMMHISRQQTHGREESRSSLVTRHSSLKSLGQEERREERGEIRREKKLREERQEETEEETK